ncbi:MAG: WD40 repeat domain-containing serine/threonine protein kinase [Phycisphaerales bacterium]
MSDATSGEGLAALERLFDEALLVPKAERDAFVASRTGGDEALRVKLMRLLAAHTSGESLMPTPPPEGMALVPLETSDPMIGQRLGAFRIVGLLGTGGMGSVYDAEQDAPRRRVAVKVLHATLIARDASHRFRLEAEVLGSLEHPGIAHVYEAGVASLAVGRIPYLAMEYVDGATLLEHARSAGLDARQRITLFISVCEAVEHAHRKGVIHRDLKPGNIMVTTSGMVKVLDFGVARLVKQDDRASSLATRVGQIVGTLQYMSPEQVLGDQRHVDTRSDVYSLGVVLYELLSFRRPYDLASTSVAEAAAIIRDYDPPSVAQFAPYCRGDLETIVTKALAKEPRERYQSAAELAAELRRYLANEPILARPVSSAYYLKKFVVRNKAVTLSAAAVVAALVVGVFGLWIGLGRAQRATRAAEAAKSAESAALAESRRHEEEARANASAAEFQSYVANLAAASGAIEAFDLAAARQHLALCPPGLRGWEWRHLEAMSDDAIGVYAVKDAQAAGEGVWDIGLSGDGRVLAGSMNSRRVAVWETDREAPPRLIDPFAITKDSRLEVIHGVSLNADGTVLACAHAWGRVASVWDVRGSKLLFVLAGHTDEVEDVEISPDGGLVATASFDGTVGLWSARSGERVGTLRGHSVAVRSLSFDADGGRLATLEASGVTLMWDVRSQRLLARSRPGPSRLGGVGQISPDGRRVLSAASGASPWIADAETGEPLVTLQGHRAEAMSAAWSPDGTRVLIGSSDRSIRMHDAADGRLLSSYRGHEHNVSTIRFAADGRTFFSSGYGDASGVRRWSAFHQTGSVSSRLHPGDVAVVVASPKGDSIASIGGRWGDVVVQDSRSGDAIGLIRMPAAAQGLAFESDGGLLVAAEDGSLSRWARDSGTVQLLAANPPPYPWLVLRLSPGAGMAYLSPAPPGVAVHTLALPGRTSTEIDRKLEAIAGLIDSDGTIALRYATATSLEALRVTTAERLWTREVPAAERWSVEVNWKAGCCVVRSGDADFAIVRTRDGSVISELVDARPGAQSLAISPEGDRVAVGTQAGETHLWSVERGARVYTLRSATNWVEAISFVPVTEGLVTCESSGAVRLWETAGRAARLRASPVRAAVAGAGAEFFAGISKQRLDAGGARQAARGAGLSEEVATEVGRLAAMQPGTPEGTFDWALSVLSNPACTERDARRAGRSLYALSRYVSASGGVQAGMALYLVRRAVSFQLREEDNLNPLLGARNRIQLARRAAEADVLARCLIEAVEAFVMQAEGKAVDAEGVAVRVKELAGPGGLDPRVRALLEELAAGGPTARPDAPPSPSRSGPP